MISSKIIPIEYIYFPSQNKGESNHVINLRTWLLEPNSFFQFACKLHV